ncbi:MAG: putative ABC transport system ATP-binding protein [Verrucomicrobiales bacterium]|jgi:putative ABC transport system ATP-binding protein
MAESPIISVTDLRYQYPSSTFSLDIPVFTAALGERVAITGPSGCGKTTLLRLTTGLIQPHAGTIAILGQDLSTLNEAEKRALRITRIGSIPQELDLLDYLSVKENMLLPFYINHTLSLTEEADQEREKLATALGLEDKASRFPHQLSQGERQRVAIARALITRPEILVADEPTGNLDGNTACQVLELIGKLIKERQTTFLMVTHDLSLLDFFDRRFDLEEACAKA